MSIKLGINLWLWTVLEIPTLWPCLNKLVKDKHCSFFATASVTKEKKVYNIDTRSRFTGKSRKLKLSTRYTNFFDSMSVGWKHRHLIKSVLLWMLVLLVAAPKSIVSSSKHIYGPGPPALFVPILSLLLKQIFLQTYAFINLLLFDIYGW
jgi:hypothetical protein